MLFCFKNTSIQENTPMYIISRTIVILHIREERNDVRV